jgi:hypothetical protein
MHNDFGVTAHTAQISMQVFRMLFPDRLISLTSPGQTTHLILQYKNTFLGTMTKSKVYKMHPANADDLKESIRVYIQGNVTLCYDILFIATARVY